MHHLGLIHHCLFRTISYCESGNAGSGYVDPQFFATDPLWDGCGCPAGPPWFYCHFTEPEGGAVEVRICRDEVYSNEITLLEQVAITVHSIKINDNQNIDCFL